MPGLIQQVKSTIKEWEMLSRGERVLAAVSGGADSVVMLRVLVDLAPELDLTIMVAHMDHALRAGESRRDHDFVKALAKGLGVEFVSRRLKKGELKVPGVSSQEAARLKRYAFLEETALALKASKVALGHTMDDQAETVLMRLLKGSSLSGLSGIRPKRGIFIRPLINSSRASIEEYARERSIAFVTDSSNLSVKYLRNRVRLALLPALQEEYNPSIKETLARTAATLSIDDSYIEKAVSRVFASALLERKAGRTVLDRSKLRRAHRAVSSRVFLEAVHSLGAEVDLSTAHVDAFFGILDGRRPNASVSLPGGLAARREYGRMIIETGGAQAFQFELPLVVPGNTIIEGAGSIDTGIFPPPKKFSGGPSTAWFDFDAVKGHGPIVARQARPGDRMAPFGMEGTRKLKDIFIDSKTPLADRKKTPVVAAGGEIIWLAGIRQSSKFSIGKGSKRALRLVFTKEPL